MVRSCGSVFAVLGSALLTAGCSSSQPAPAAGAPSQAQAPKAHHDPLSPRRSSRAATPTTQASAPVARTTAPARSAPAVAQSRAVLAPAFAAPAQAFAAPAPAAPKPATAAIRAINATCPVLVGSRVDPTITTRWQGQTIAFSSTTARLMWETDPDRYSANVASATSSAAPADASFARMAPAAAPAAVSGTIVQTGPVPTAAARVASPGVATRATPAPAPKPAVAAVPPPAAPAAEEGECDECPGGVCRVPGR